MCNVGFYPVSGWRNGAERRAFWGVGIKKQPAGCDFKINGGSERDRTADLLRAKQALSHLSYGPTTVERVVYTPSDVGNQVVFCSKAHFFYDCGNAASVSVTFSVR